MESSTFSLSHALSLFVATDHGVGHQQSTPPSTNQLCDAAIRRCCAAATSLLRCCDVVVTCFVCLLACCLLSACPLFVVVVVVVVVVETRRFPRIQVSPTHSCASGKRLVQFFILARTSMASRICVVLVDDNAVSCRARIPTQQ